MIPDRLLFIFMPSSRYTHYRHRSSTRYMPGNMSGRRAPPAQA
ncbi:hypothetical protein C7S14_7565 [Burkholderia cepacia]|nr:hypothetical protein C7S14_7565 [Burkholderia cepacia]